MAAFIPKNILQRYKSYIGKVFDQTNSTEIPFRKFKESFY